MNTSTNQPTPRWVVQTTTPEEVYTDRTEHLEYLYQTALNAITRRSISTVLLGQRRMGKTEIFKRVVNRLFFEQENYTKLQESAVPIFFSFQDKIIDRWDFAGKYVENFLRWYFAFRLRDSRLISSRIMRTDALISLIRSSPYITTGIKGALNLLEEIEEKAIISPEDEALWLPRRVSDWDNSTIVMFLDEFQNTRLPQYNFDIVGLMQEAVESPTCPHFVTGSAMSILSHEILGRGSLFGRFRSERIGPLTEYWASELTMRNARYYGTLVSEDMASVVAARCGGNPFYITAVMRQAAKLKKPLSDEEKINEILALDLSSGVIWSELNDQVERWIHRINEYGITKWVLYLSALEQKDRIDLERIQKELYEKDQQKVSIDNIRNVLIKLSRGDLIDYPGMGDWFRKVEDPILLEFLKVWGRTAVEGQKDADVQNELIARYRTLERQIHDHLGYIGEVYLAQILWNSQNKTLPGKYLHVSEDIPVDWHFNYIRHRVRLGAAKDMEVDVYGAAGSEIWLCESKWWRDRKAGVKEVESLLKKGDQVRQDMGSLLQILRLWFFAYDGFTPKAEQLMHEKGILWSDHEDLDNLLTHAGLKKLPNV